MSFRLIAKNPVGTLSLNAAVANIGLATWVQITASLGFGCNAVEITNPSTSVIAISKGAVGKETAAGNVLYTINPGSSTIVWELPKGTRISVRAIDVAVTTGYVVLNFFG